MSRGSGCCDQRIRLHTSRKALKAAPGTPDEFAAFIDSEAAKGKKLIEPTGMRAEVSGTDAGAQAELEFVSLR